MTAVSGSEMDRARARRATSIRRAVVEAGARWSACQYELVALIAELDASGAWTIEDAPSCAHWVADALDVEVCTAREWLRIGRALQSLPEIEQSFAKGALSYSKVRALTRVATPDTAAELCTLAEQVPASRLTRQLAVWRARHETPEETDTRQHAARRFTWRLDVDGSIVGSFRLPPVQAAFVTQPVDAAVVRRQQDASADASSSDRARWPSFAQQRADALVACMQRGGANVDVEVVMHVRGDGCTLDDGTTVAGSIVERIAPHAFLRALIHDAEGRPINASGRQRHPTMRQRRVVRARDERCVDCGSTEFLQYDHDPSYNVTRHTIVDELALRCALCHVRRHAREECVVVSLGEH